MNKQINLQRFISNFNLSPIKRLFEYDTFNNWVKMDYQEYSGEKGNLNLNKTFDYYQQISYWGEKKNWWKSIKSLLGWAN